MYFICIEIQINYFFSKGFPILSGDWPPKKAFKTFGKLVVLSDLLNLCMKIKVRIINGKGINGSTWVKPNAIDLSLIHISEPTRRYAIGDGGVGV